MTEPVPSFEQRSPRLDDERYQAICADLRADVESLAPPLHALALATVEPLLRGGFSRVAALLPLWLSDLLPIPPLVVQRLGLAHLYGWWHYAALDDALDTEGPPAAVLGGNLALLRAVEIYRSLELDRAPCWAEFLRLFQCSVECHAAEMQLRATAIADLTPAQLQAINFEFIADRAAPLGFAVLAQAHLTGLPAGDQRGADLLAALRCFVAIRQIGDDAADWLEDLRRGQVNFVAARLLARAAERGDNLDLERLAGRQIGAEDFWQAIEEDERTLGAQALALLAPYGACRLRELIVHQLNVNAAAAAAARTQRAQLRTLFGVGKPGIDNTRFVS